jgi:hypothetical protein
MMLDRRANDGTLTSEQRIALAADDRTESPTSCARPRSPGTSPSRSFVTRSPAATWPTLAALPPSCTNAFTATTDLSPKGDRYADWTPQGRRPGLAAAPVVSGDWSPERCSGRRRKRRDIRDAASRGRRTESSQVGIARGWRREEVQDRAIMPEPPGAVRFALARLGPATGVGRPVHRGAPR